MLKIVTKLCYVPNYAPKICFGVFVCFSYHLGFGIEKN